MAEQFSFDVVSEVNMQEMKNVVDQATKEIKQRFDSNAGSGCTGRSAGSSRPAERSTRRTGMRAAAGG